MNLTSTEINTHLNRLKVSAGLKAALHLASPVGNTCCRQHFLSGSESGSSSRGKISIEILLQGLPDLDQDSKCCRHHVLPSRIAMCKAAFRWVWLYKLTCSCIYSENTYMNFHELTLNIFSLVFTSETSTTTWYGRLFKTTLISCLRNSKKLQK